MDPVAFTVDVPIYPTIDPGDYLPSGRAGGCLDRRKRCRRSPDPRLRKASSPWVDPAEPRTPVEGDQVSLDLAISENGEQFQDPIEDAQFILGESELFEGPQNAGHGSSNPGEVDRSRTSPLMRTTKQRPSNCGARPSIHVTLTGIKERESAESSTTSSPRPMPAKKASTRLSLRSAVICTAARRRKHGSAC